jgi:ribosome-binding factor A
MSRRLLKAAEAIREVVSMSILTELRDPRVKNVTVVGVEVAPDMRSAKVNVSIMGSEKKQELTLQALQNAAGFLQSKIAERIDTRYTPRLTFVLDKGVKQALEVLRILNEVLPKDGTAAETPVPGEQAAAAAERLEQRKPRGGKPSAIPDDTESARAANAVDSEEEQEFGGPDRA